MKRKVLKPNVIGGGQAIPMGDNFYYMRGRKHAQGGIDIGANPKTGLEVEDGEVMHITNKDIKVYSSVPFLNGRSPAQKVMGGENPTKVFNEQEKYKKIKGINDDGSKKKEIGGKSTVNHTLTKRDLDELNNREGMRIARNDKPLENTYPELWLFGIRNIKPIYNSYKNIKSVKKQRFWFNKEKSRKDVINDNKKSMIHNAVQIINPLFAMGGKTDNELSLTRRQYRTGGLYSLTVDGETKMRQFPTGERTKAEYGIIKKYAKKLYDVMTEPDTNEPGIVLGGNNIATKMTYGEAKSKGLHKKWRGTNKGVAPNVSRANVTKIVKGVQNTRKINQAANASKTKNVVNYTTKKIIQSKVKPIGKNSNVAYTKSSGEAVPRSWVNYSNGTTLNSKVTGTARRGNMENISITRDNKKIINNAKLYWEATKGKTSKVLNSIKDKPYAISTGVGITGGVTGELIYKNSNNSNNITVPYKSDAKSNNIIKINNTSNNKQNTTKNKPVFSSEDIKEITAAQDRLNDKTKQAISKVDKAIATARQIRKTTRGINNSLKKNKREKTSNVNQQFIKDDSERRIDEWLAGKKAFVWKDKNTTNKTNNVTKKTNTTMPTRTTNNNVKQVINTNTTNNVQVEPTRNTSVTKRYTRRPVNNNKVTDSRVLSRNAENNRSIIQHILNTANLENKENKIDFSAKPSAMLTSYRSNLLKVDAPTPLPPGYRAPKDSWIKRTMNKLGVEPNDVASLIPNIAGSIITHSINSRMLNTFKEPEVPIARQAVKLKTRINIEPQLDKMRESLAEYERQVDNNTASSNVALARKNNFRLANIMNTNALYADKENKETALINQDKLNRQTIADANIREYNEYLARRNQYQNTIAEKRAENSVGLINNINAGIQNVLGNIEKRRSEDRTIKAMMAPYPDLPIELFEKGDIITTKAGDWYRAGIGHNRRGMKNTI